MKRSQINNLKRKVLKANLQLIKMGLVFHNFGNISLRFKDLCFIKPSGVDLLKITYKDISLVSIKTGKIVSGKKPSVDTAVHLELYKKYDELNSIAHTHSKFATSWAQSLKCVPCLGTTHGDFFLGNIPITKSLSKKEISKNYESSIAKSIISELRKYKINNIPGILLANHGVFAWSENLQKCIKNCELIELICELAFNTKLLNKQIVPIKKCLNEKHFFRKNGPKAYYGQ